MRLKALLLTFFVFFDLSFTKGLEHIKSIKAKIEEPKNGKKEEEARTWIIKVKLPNYALKRAVLPELNKDEIEFFDYSKSIKKMYYPMLDQVITNEIDENDQFLIKVIRDMKISDDLSKKIMSKKEAKVVLNKVSFLFKGKLLKSIKYPSGTNVVFEQYKNISGIDFPCKISIFKASELEAILIFSEVELNVELDLEAEWNKSIER